MNHGPAREIQERFDILALGFWQTVETILIDRILDVWVKSVFSSTVATGKPFRNSTRSMQYSLAVE